MRTIYRCLSNEASDGLSNEASDFEKGSCEYLAKYQECAKRSDECCMTSYMLGFDTLNIDYEYGQGDQVRIEIK